MKGSEVVPRTGDGTYSQTDGARSDGPEWRRRHTGVGAARRLTWSRVRRREDGKESLVPEV